MENNISQHSLHSQIEFLNEMKDQLEEYSKGNIEEKAKHESLQHKKFISTIVCNLRNVDKHKFEADNNSDPAELQLTQAGGNELLDEQIKYIQQKQNNLGVKLMSLEEDREEYNHYGTLFMLHVEILESLGYLKGVKYYG